MENKEPQLSKNTLLLGKHLARKEKKNQVTQEQWFKKFYSNVKLLTQFLYVDVDLINKYNFTYEDVGMQKKLVDG